MVIGAPGPIIAPFCRGERGDYRHQATGQAFIHAQKIERLAAMSSTTWSGAPLPLIAAVIAGTYTEVVFADLSTDRFRLVYRGVERRRSG